MARRTLLQSLASLIRSETASLTPFTFLGHPEETGRDLLRRDWIWTSLGPRGEVISFPLAQTGEGIAECELVKWLVKEGDRIKQFDKICEVQSDKASIEISSPYDGQIKSTPHEVGDVILVGNTLVEIELDEHQSPSSQPQISSSTDSLPESSTSRGARPLASPAVRLFAKERNIELSEVRGTGPAGRILKNDVEGFLGDLKQATKEGYLEIKGYRRSMFKSMSASLTIPHFHFCDDIDLTELANLRQQLESDDRLKGANLTYLPILVKALSVALKDFPEVNSSLSPDHSHLILHLDHNIGIAMMTEEGLVVPNIKGVQDKSIVEISQQLDRLKDSAFERKLSKSDMSETTITISNIGPIGGRYASPLITPPQTAIVAIGRVRTALLPKSEMNNEMKSVVHAFPSLPISWGADHRVLDGATLVRFSNKWKALIEEPGRLILGLK